MARQLSILILMTSLLLCSLNAWSQPFDPNDPSKADLNVLKREGRLVNIRVVPKEKNLSIFLLGKKGADVDLKNAHVDVKVMNGKKKRTISSSLKEDHFEPDEELPDTRPLTIEVNTKLRGGVDTFHFQLP